MVQKNEDMIVRQRRERGDRVAPSQDMVGLTVPNQPARRPMAGVLWLAGAAMTVATAITAKELGPVSPMAAIGPAPARIAAEPGAVQEEAQNPIIEPTVLATPAPLSLEGQVEPDTSLRWFNGRPVRPARTITMKVTAYSADAASCYPFADGQTATLHSVDANGGFLVAADTDLLPFGTMLSIDGYSQGRVVPVLDRGGAIKGNRLDLLFPSHQAALEWGVRTLDVVIWEYADGKPAIDPRKQRS
ncbi:MAG: 3D domain-containing protein [Phycisphaerales bacterium JB060]